MRTIRLLVCGLDGKWSGIVPAGMALRAVAALSADPATLEELQQAVRRFIRFPAGAIPLAELLPGDWDTPHDLGLLVIDMAGRLVAAEAETVRLARKGEVFWLELGDEGQVENTEVNLPFQLGMDWLLSDQLEGWRELSQERRESIGRSRLDFRKILYGQPLFDYIAVRVWDEYQEAEASGLIEQLVRGQAQLRWNSLGKHSGLPELRGGSAAGLEEDDPPLERFDFRGSNAEWEIIRRLHVDWLLTPRSDLGERSPRQSALADHERIANDLEDQAQRWSVLDEEPPSVAVDSIAYRFSSFGTHEWVEYYELVRELLWDSWFRLVASCSESTMPERVRRIGQRLQNPGGGDEVLGLRSGSAEQRRVCPQQEWRQAESVRLAARAEEWMDQPGFDTPGKRTPRSIIERERCRLPELVSAEDGFHGPDCPVCELLARSSQPAFWSLDGCNFDDDFAFDQYSETDEEWREKQVDWRHFMEKSNQQE